MDGKGEVELEGGISHQSTAKEGIAPPLALPQACMERPYNATTEEVMAYYQVRDGWKGEREREDGGRKDVREGRRGGRGASLVCVCWTHGSGRAPAPAHSLSESSSFTALFGSLLPSPPPPPLPPP